MDNSRFKRRETQHTQRHITADATGGIVQDIGAPASSWHPNPVTTAPRLPNSQNMDVMPATPKVSAAVTTAPVVPKAAPAPVQPAVAAAPRAPIDMGLPGGESDVKTKLDVKSSKWRAMKPRLIKGTAIALVVVLGLGGFAFSQSYFKIRKVFKGGSVSAVALTPNVSPTLLNGEGDGRINVLLLGRGGGSHEAPDLTDTIMIASIDPVNHTSTLLSIPRDLWVSIPNFGSMKLNAAWETGKYKYLGKISSSMANSQATQAGFDLVDKTITNVIGIPIHYNMLVDFKAFSQAVDTVNGVSVNVPTDLVDPTMAWENNHNPVLAKAGLQTFDGVHALIYARSRETTSDFARAQRQRALLVAIKEKVVSLGTISNPVKLAGLMSAFSNNAQTDLSIGDASRLYAIAKDTPSSTVNSISLADEGNSYVTTANINGQSVVEPKTGVFSYTAIQDYIRNALKDGYIKKEEAKILVLNGSTTVGLAATKSTELKGFGYTITGTANAPTKTYTTTQIVDLTGGKNKYTQNYLEKRFKVTATTALPDAAIQANGADFVIILGSDASTSSQN
jgi:LCP family protein required for cell wall assembly